MPDDALYIQAGSRGVVDAWFSLDASSSSNITNTGVRDPNDPVFAVYSGPDSGLLTSPDSVAYAGAYTDWALMSPGWAWTETGTQSSALVEAVGQTTESPAMYTDGVSTRTSLVTLDRSTSASELNSAAAVLRTETGSSTEGGSWSSTSSAGSYTSPGSGISPQAQALVPVGSDGLAFAMYNSPTNSVSDYMPMGHDDLLSGGNTTVPGAETLQRGYTIGLATQQTLPSPAGTPSTNTNYAEPGTGGGTGTPSTPSAGGGGAIASGIHFLKTAGQIVAAAAKAEVAGLTSQLASSQAPLIVCNGNTCVEVTTSGSTSIDENGVGHEQREPILVQTAGGGSKSDPEFEALKLKVGKAVSEGLTNQLAGLDGFMQGFRDGLIDTAKAIAGDTPRAAADKLFDYATGRNLLPDRIYSNFRDSYNNGRAAIGVASDAASLTKEFLSLPEWKQLAIMAGHGDKLKDVLSPQMYQAAALYATTMRSLEEQLKGMSDEQFAENLGYIKGYILYTILEGAATDAAMSELQVAKMIAKLEKKFPELKKAFKAFMKDEDGSVGLPRDRNPDPDLPKSKAERSLGASEKVTDANDLKKGEEKCVEAEGEKLAPDTTRPFKQLDADIRANPNNWEAISAHSEKASRKGARQHGASTQTIYRHRDTGETIIRHTVIDDVGKVVDDHFRPHYKPRVGDLNDGQ